MNTTDKGQTAKKPRAGTNHILNENSVPIPADPDLDTPQKRGQPAHYQGGLVHQS
jgi:hypothetical protein